VRLAAKFFSITEAARKSASIKCSLPEPGWALQSEGRRFGCARDTFFTARNAKVKNFVADPGRKAEVLSLIVIL
jgi:hypothetical protein